MNATDLLDREDEAPFAARAIFAVLARLERGRLDLVTPEGIRRRFQGTATGPHAELVVHDYAALPRIARGAEIGLFEAWRDGAVETPDLTALLRLAAANHAALGRVFRGSPVTAFLLRIAHALRANTRAGARRNIHAHYDLGNDFYALWLDPSMTYSSAIFSSPLQDLRAAQNAKYDRIIDALALAPDDRVLEVGCGWGGFAERAVQRTGCSITGVTISQAQLGYARERIARAGLADRVDLHFRDYRDVGGEFDRIVSIEMVEAVGERYWPGYFRMLHDRLRPGGRAMLQSITIDEGAFEGYRRSSDFIREYIFPGGMLPSVERLHEEARRAGLQPVETFRFGRDYAETLRRWRSAFDAAEAEVRALGFDDAFLAAWRFYLHYCEAGFDEGRIDVVQLELTRP